VHNNGAIRPAMQAHACACPLEIDLNVR